MEKDGREEYPEESVDWEQIGQKDEMWWCTKAIDKRSNAELVQSGVFAGEITVIKNDNPCYLMARLYKIFQNFSNTLNFSLFRTPGHKGYCNSSTR